MPFIVDSQSMLERRYVIELERAHPGRDASRGVGSDEPEVLGVVGGLVDQIARRARTARTAPSGGDGLTASADDVAADEDAADERSADAFAAALDRDLAAFEAGERLKGAIDDAQLTALARMHGTALAELGARHAQSWVDRTPLSARDAVVREVAAATGLGVNDLSVRLELATGPRARTAFLREQVASGATTLFRACQLVSETRHLPDELLDAVVRAALAPTRDGAGLPPARFRQRLRRAMIAAETAAGTAGTTNKAARKRIGVFAQLYDDGTGSFTVTNDAEKIAAAYDRADAAARAARQGGDPRTLDELRADFITGSAIFGWPDEPLPEPREASAHDATGDPSPSTVPAAGASPTGRAEPRGQADPVSQAEPGGQAEPAGPGRQTDPAGPGRQTDPAGPGRQTEPAGPGRQTDPAGPGRQAGLGEQAESAEPGGRAEPGGQAEPAEPGGQAESAEPGGHAESAEPGRQAGPGGQADSVGQLTADHDPQPDPDLGPRYASPTSARTPADVTAQPSSTQDRFTAAEPASTSSPGTGPPGDLGCSDHCSDHHADHRADHRADQHGATPGAPAPEQTPRFGAIRAHPPGKVWIVVPWSTAAGLDDEPCELPGHGWVSAAQARQIITAEGSIWQTMLADVDTGRALALSRRGYRPSPEMVEYVQAVDGTCRAPACDVAATRCDIDHAKGFDHSDPAATTRVSELGALDRPHHRLRTASLWSAERGPDATVAWRTGAGRRYLTYPRDWLEHVRAAATRQQPDAGQQPDASPRRSKRPAARSAVADDPPPF